ncbi:MAG TPA: ribonuclease R [Burkholderiaceae bacterium]|nr:ribonuclease R [Burkholderiaceae bacterium]
MARGKPESKSETPAARAGAAGPSVVLEAMTRAGSPLRPEELGALLALEPGHYPDLEQTLSELERTGQVVRNRAGLLLIAARANLVSGQVQGHRDGFGFLIRDDHGPDVMLSESEMSKLMHGDRALVRVTGIDRRGRPEGEIVDVTERRTERLVGRLLNERGVSVVVPEDQRIRHDILVPPQAGGGARDGQVVVVQIVQQPQRNMQAVGRVVEVLGEIDDPGMEIEIAVRKFGVPHEFSIEALRAAEALPKQVRRTDLHGRIDLRDVALVTIDAEDARDFDDAVYCESDGRRGWRLVVAIADVDHYVPSGSQLDKEAQVRSTSVYFPRRVIPMLPEALSNELCSLKPAVDRLVMVCDMTITKHGGVRGYQFYPAVMHSQGRLTYNEVWEALSNPSSRAAAHLEKLLPRLHELYEVYLALARARARRGALELETTETQIICDANGRIERIVPRVRNDAHRLIEECMLAANVCAADFLRRKKHDALLRVHEGPTPQKLESLRATLKTLGLHLAGGEAPQPSDYAELITRIRSRSDASLLNMLLLRSMQQAQYSPHNVGHFGLAYEAYTHFTSPIRRYPDLLVHRALKAVLAGKHYVPQLAQAGANETAAALPRWEQLGLVCSANERRADDASRDVEAWLKSYYVRERVGETFSGSVSAVVPFGLFVVLDALYVEGLVHVSELGSEYFQFNEAVHELRGERTGIRFRLGDRLTVQVARVDLEARRIDFRMMRPADLRAGETPSARTTARAKSGEGVEQRRRRQAARAERIAARRAKQAQGQHAPGKPGPRDVSRRHRRR